MARLDAVSLGPGFATSRKIGQTLGRVALLSCVAAGSAVIISACKGSTDINSQPGVKERLDVTERYGSGRFKRAKLQASTAIQGATYEAGTEITFHENGRVSNGTLLSGTIEGIGYKTKTKVSFYENGRVLKGTLGSDSAIQGITYKAGEEVWFHANGKVRFGELAADETIQGVTYKAGKSTVFPPCGGRWKTAEFTMDYYENGKWNESVVTTDGSVEKVTYKDGRVYFHENGKVAKGTLAADTTLDEIVYRSGTIVYLNSDGRPESLHLAADTTIRGVVHKAGAFLHFAQDGTVKETECVATNGGFWVGEPEGLGKRDARGDINRQPTGNGPSGSTAGDERGGGVSGSPGVHPGGTELGAEPAGTSVRFQSVNLKKRAGACKKKTEGDCAKISVSYPKITHAPSAEARDKMNAAIVDQISRFIGPAAKSVEQAISNWQDEYLKDRDSEFPESLEEEIKVDVEYSGPQVLCLAFDHYSCSSRAAHPNGSLVYLNLNTTTGQTLALRDFLKASHEEELTASAEKNFRKLKHLGPNVSLARAGYDFDGNKFNLNRNFAIKKKGLVFHYDAYEIAPGSDGPTELVIKWSEIKSLLEPAGPIKLPVE